MEQRNELLCGIPALILGAPSERVFFYVHGKMGSKEEALDFAAVAGSVRKTGRIVVAEETSDRGCVADELFARLGQAQIPFVGRKKNLGRRFVTHGATAILLREAGLDADGIVGLIGEVCGHEA